jgi:hypothetical protein
MTGLQIPPEFSALAQQWLTAASCVGLGPGKFAVVYLSGDSGAWVDSGVQVAEGQQITLLAHGEVWLSREQDLCFGPNVGLWYRVGDGLIARSRGNGVTVVTKARGTIKLIAKPPGEWANRHGEFLPDYPHSGAAGGLLVIVLVWNGHANQGLEAFIARGGGAIAAAELARQKDEKPLPRGWEPLWRVGETGMFWEATNGGGQKVISCQCHNDAAILKYPVDVPLDDSLQLEWSWRIARLPSRIAENSLATHDYVSVAVEFDNGQDLTYLWSCSLPVGLAFRCPIPWWDRHETHIVARTGLAELGTWKSEAKSLLVDYLDTVGGERPQRVVGVWLITLSPFQRGVAEWDCGEIALHRAGEVVRIGP